MSENSVSTTPGFGLNIATKVINNKHHQRVISSSDAYRGTVTPAAIALAYGADKCVGSTMVFNAANRVNGGIAKLNFVQIRLNDANFEVSASDMKLVIFSAEPLSAVIDNQPFVVGVNEVGFVQAVIEFNGADFSHVGGNMYLATKECNGLLLQSEAASSNLFGVLVAKGMLVITEADAIGVTIQTERQ